MLIVDDVRRIKGEKTPINNSRAFVFYYYYLVFAVGIL